jgi:hypothetical protein
VATTNSIPELLTPLDAGRAINVTSRRIRALAEAGEIEHVVINGSMYFTTQDLVAYIDKNRRPKRPDTSGEQSVKRD